MCVLKETGSSDIKKIKDRPLTRELLRGNQKSRGKFQLKAYHSILERSMLSPMSQESTTSLNRKGILEKKGLLPECTDGSSLKEFNKIVEDANGTNIYRNNKGNCPEAMETTQ